jgi:hypothetical protein
MDNQELLDNAVEVALGLADSLEDRLMSGAIIPDLRGWIAKGRPLRFELQVREAALWGVDALEWGAESMRKRLSVTGLACSRYLAEIAAQIAWLVEPTDSDERQKRACERHAEAIRAERKTVRHIQEREKDPKKKEADGRTIATMAALEAHLVRVAGSLGLTPLGEPPTRMEMFDRYLPNMGGYGFFAMTSTMGSHPGLGLGGLFAKASSSVVNVDRAQEPLMRAYIVKAQMDVASHIARSASDALKMDLRQGESLVGWLQERDRIAPLINERFRTTVWG